MVRVAFIINGSKRIPFHIRDVLNQCEVHPEIESILIYTEKQKEAIEIAKMCSTQNFDVVVTVGGDGTMNEVLNGLLASKISTLPILAILSNGTGNDFIKSAKLKTNPRDFVNAIIEKKTIPVDIAKIDSFEKIDYFLNIADVGFGGKVIEILEQQRKYIKGRGSYALAILRAFTVYRKPMVSVLTDSFSFIGPVLMVAICNGSVFGNGLTINPFAKMNDGKLNITLLAKVSLFDYLKNLKNLKRGNPIVHKEAIYLETSSIEISVLQGKAVTEMDGEFLNAGNMKISLHDKKIEILNF